MVLRINLLNNKPSHTIKWPNENTAINAVTIIANLALKTTNAMPKLFFAVNLPVRFFSIVSNYEKADLKLAFDIAAFVAIFFPYGVPIAIGLDLTYEALNYWNFRRCQASLNWDNQSLAIVPVDEYVNACQRLALGGENPLVSALRRVDITNERKARGFLNLPLGGELDLNLIKKHRDEAVEDYKERIKGASEPLAEAFAVIIQDVQGAYNTLEKIYKKK